MVSILLTHLATNPTTDPVQANSHSAEFANSAEQGILCCFLFVENVWITMWKSVWIKVSGMKCVETRQEIHP